MNTDKHERHFVYFFRIPVIILLCCLFIMGIFSRRGWLDWRRMVLKNSELASEIQKTASARMLMEKQIEAFEGSRGEQERIIRSRLGYIRSNETVVEFE